MPPIKAECVGGPLDGESTEIVKHEFWVPVDEKGKIYTTADALNSSALRAMGCFNLYILNYQAPP